MQLCIIDKRSSDALVIENVNGLSINNMTIKWEEENPEKNWQSALVLKNISEGLIAESKAEQGCKTFVQVSKAESKNVVMRNNNTSKADKPLSY